MAEAFSSAKGGNKEAESAVKSKVTSSGIAKAAASAQVEAESTGGSVVAVQEVNTSLRLSQTSLQSIAFDMWMAVMCTT